MFGIDPANPDPGRVTLRRLNRVEYRNTIRDLMGVDYNTTENFPADDTGYGFDNIGDVLSVSPLLMEKYLKAAEKIVEQAVPTRAAHRGRAAHRRRAVPRRGRATCSGDRMSYYKPATVATYVQAAEDRTDEYRCSMIELDGEFEFDPGRCRVTFTADGKKLHEEEYGWADRRKPALRIRSRLGARASGSSQFKLEPLTAENERINSMDYRIRSVVVRGPLEEEHRIENRKYRRFFPKGRAAGGSPRSAMRTPARCIAAFARRAYRRPADEQTVGTVVAIAKATYDEPGRDV